MQNVPHGGGLPQKEHVNAGHVYSDNVSQVPSMMRVGSEVFYLLTIFKSPLGSFYTCLCGPSTLTGSVRTGLCQPPSRSMMRSASGGPHVLGSYWYTGDTLPRIGSTI